MTGSVGIQRHHVKQRRRVVLGAEGGQREIGAATCPGAGRGSVEARGGDPPAATQLAPRRSLNGPQRTNGAVLAPSLKNCA